MANTREQIEVGDVGILKTNKLMKKYVNDYYTHPRIKDIAMRLNTIDNIFNYVVDTIKYQNDPPDVELVASVKHTVLGKRKYGDCDDLSVALATLLKARGYQVAFRNVAWRSDIKDDRFTHVYVVVFSGGREIPLDPTMGKSGYNKQVVYRRKKDVLI
jgi:transglutaminase-like putative cysteine protease